MLCKSLKKHASLDVSDPCIRINHFAKPTHDHEKPLVIQGGTDPGGEGGGPPRTRVEDVLCDEAPFDDIFLRILVFLVI